MALLIFTVLSLSNPLGIEIAVFDTYSDCEEIAAELSLYTVQAEYTCEPVE